MARLVWALVCVLGASALCIPGSAAAPPPSQSPKGAPASPPPEKVAAAPSPAEKKSPVTPTPSPPKGAVDCSTVMYSMIDCLDYVTAGSNQSMPDESCCEEIKTVVQASPACLCEALQAAVKMQIAVNMTRATGLPAICKIPVPGVGSCKIADTPGAAPAPSTSKTSPSSPPPALPAAAPSSPVVPSPPAEPPAKAHNASAPASSRSGAPRLPISVIVLVICLSTTSFLYF